MKKHALAFGIITALGFNLQATADNTPKDIHVYKSPTCGCCTEWVNHLKTSGFEVEVTETDNLNPIKQQANLTPALASCHTAFMGDYVIEGHVPASDIERLIAESPDARGLTAPGMPAGSPGMEVGGRKDPFQVLLFNQQGQTRVFAEHN